MNEIQNKIFSLLTNMGFATQDLSVSDNLYDRGLDSLRLMELVAELEDGYDIEFPFEDLDKDSLSSVLNIEKTILKLSK